jgi:hypothetical protein
MCVRSKRRSRTAGERKIHSGHNVRVAHLIHGNYRFFCGDPIGTVLDGTGDCTDDPQCPVGNVTWFEAV